MLSCIAGKNGKAGKYVLSSPIAIMNPVTPKPIQNRLLYNISGHILFSEVLVISKIGLVSGYLRCSIVIHLLCMIVIRRHSQEAILGMQRYYPDRPTMQLNHDKSQVYLGFLHMPVES